MRYDNDRLGAALKLYLGTDPLPMHMPGGKRNPDFVSQAFMRDITEIGGFDNRGYRGTSQENKADIYFYKDI